MQFVNCAVRLGGNLNNVVPRQNVSVPEVVILRAIHGEDAVVNFTFAKEENTSPRAEIDRLEALYKPATVRGVFPGANPRLPTSYRDIGIELDAPEAKAPDKPAAARSGNGGGKKSSTDPVTPQDPPV